MKGKKQESLKNNGGRPKKVSSSLTVSAGGKTLVQNAKADSREEKGKDSGCWTHHRWRKVTPTHSLVVVDCRGEKNFCPDQGSIHKRP